MRVGTKTAVYHLAEDDLLIYREVDGVDKHPMMVIGYAKPVIGDRWRLMLSDDGRDFLRITTVVEWVDPQ